MSLMLKFTRQLALRLPVSKFPKNRRSSAKIDGRPRVLVIGIYIAREENYVAHIVDEFGRSKIVDVEQRWICLKGQPPNACVAAVTVRKLDEYVPKWQLVNELITPQDLDQFDFFIICDDDILLGRNFVDCFISEQLSLDFALAQPARTWRSFTDHAIVRRRLFTRARQTNFVEAGPVVSFRRDFLKIVYPFSLESPMGWGYDLTWPVVARELGLAIGVIDGVPVDHSLRPRSSLYNMQKQIDVMAAYLSTRPHVREQEITRAVRTYR
jgi:hypothetical protein